MNSVDTNAVLNRLLVLHHRSLPMYLSYAVPWKQPGREAASRTLDLVIAAQKALVERIYEAILENGGSVEFGRFPFAFTALHDLAFDYLLRKVIERQEQAVGEIEICVAALRMAPLAQALAQEALGEAKGHLDSLREAADELARRDHVL
jgi:hypothetical protein